MLRNFPFSTIEYLKSNFNKISTNDFIVVKSKPPKPPSRAQAVAEAEELFKWPLQAVYLTSTIYS